ncbi:MAG: 1,4-dihydroxy-6-naphthoate synthase [Chitinophagaceae bacterium]
MKLQLGFSPCPNDTFIFDAWVNRKIDTEGLEAIPVLEDVETLNEWAFQGKLAISKISFNAFLQVAGSYLLLRSGSALGQGCGPLLIARSALPGDQVVHSRIAIPGIHTTANMLLDFAYPQATHRLPMIFSEIENAVLEGRADLGLIIHESRFTYQKKGLVKIQDLGEYWEKATKCPIPLGGIAIRQDFSPSVQQKVDRVIRRSIEFAFSQYPDLPDFVTQNAQEMEEEVMRQHINLYVNKFSLDLGPLGEKAIITLAGHAFKNGSLHHCLPKNWMVSPSSMV